MAEGTKVWIDQDLCTGDGLCADTISKVFEIGDDGLAFVKDETGSFDGSSPEHPLGAKGLAQIAISDFALVFESAEDCPGLCIFIEDAQGNSIGPNTPKK